METNDYKHATETESDIIFWTYNYMWDIIKAV